MGTPEEIAWEEPWREQFPLWVPLRQWWKVGLVMGAEVRRVGPLVLVLVALTLGVVWYQFGSAACGPALRLLLMLAISSLVVPVAAFFGTGFLFRCLYTFYPPFGEVTRAGVRLPMKFIPFSKIETIEVVESGGRAWLSLVSGRAKRRAGIPSSVDLNSLRALLDARDREATKPLTSRSAHESLGRLAMGMIAFGVGLMLMAFAVASLFTLMFAV